jgi:chemotaxis protein CheD
MDYILGIGDSGIITEPGDRLITHALASCVAVTFFSESPKLAAMIHIALPEPSLHTTPHPKSGYYASSGLPELIRLLTECYGCQTQYLKVHLIGGASSVKKADAFKVGEKNLHKIQKVLTHYGMNFNSDEVSGHVSRTVTIDLIAGSMTIYSQPMVI